ncbi:effector-associated domain 2-containing protein [Amycolatopsis plumensis]|uniref:Guanylate cyclase domain-containing protein n=1 Tax=Amycolatopsis plumensis TaxID=236508 RepID=A0ABV5U3N0_9PSEU
MTEPHDPIRDLVQRAHEQDTDRVEFDPHAGLADLQRRQLVDHDPAPRGDPGRGVHSYAAAHHKTIMAVDIAGYNDPRRTMAHRLVIHDGFWKIMRTAFADAGIPWDALFRENTGDGVMIHLPTEVAKADLVAELPERMLAELRRYNEVHAAEANVRLRMALHAGEVYQGSHGTISDATSHAFRLLDAPEVKVALKESKAVLALVVSNTFYQDVVRADPAADTLPYRRIPIENKETKTEAWLRLLGAANDVPVSVSNRGDRVAFPALIDALLAVPCVRSPESRKLLLEMFPRREIADIVPYHAEDRLHVIALARACLRFDGGLVDLLNTVRAIEPESPQVIALAATIGKWVELHAPPTRGSAPPRLLGSSGAPPPTA